MWLVVVREPKPDAPAWKGRRWLAAIDAVLWPALWVLLVHSLDKPPSSSGSVVMAVAVLFAFKRLHQALWVNHRYWFTTWRWGRWLAVLLAFGWLLKLTLSVLSWAR